MKSFESSYRVTRRPVTHTFVTNVIASFADIVCLKRYLIALLIFLSLFSISASIPYRPAVATEPAENLSYSLVSADHHLSLDEQRQFFLENSQDVSATFFSQQLLSSLPKRNDLPKLLTNSAYLSIDVKASSFPKTIRVTSDGMTVEKLAKKWYGNLGVVPEIIAANTRVNFTNLKPGTAVILPRPHEKEQHSAPYYRKLSLRKSRPAKVEAELQAQESVESQVQPKTLNSSTYVIDVPNQEVLDLYLRIVTAETNPYWDYEAVLRTAQIIVNRVKSGRFGDNLYEVLTNHNQFEVYTSGVYLEVTPNEVQRKAALDALKGEQAMNENIVFFCNTFLYEIEPWWHTLKHEFTYDDVMYFSDPRFQ